MPLNMTIYNHWPHEDFYDIDRAWRGWQEYRSLRYPEKSVRDLVRYSEDNKCSEYPIHEYIKRAYPGFRVIKASSSLEDGLFVDRAQIESQEGWNIGGHQPPWFTTWFDMQYSPPSQAVAVMEEFEKMSDVSGTVEMNTAEVVEDTLQILNQSEVRLNVLGRKLDEFGRKLRRYSDDPETEFLQARDTREAVISFLAQLKKITY